MATRILVGDVVDRLRELEEESVQCVVTSPPYWGLRDYGTGGQLGLEKTPEEHVEKMVAVFREVRRVLRKDGICWVNYGDAYASSGMKGSGGTNNAYAEKLKIKGRENYKAFDPVKFDFSGLKPKDLVGMPWRVAFGLQADGWWLRSDVIWAKANPMPESVTDRPTKSHEYVFLLTKSARYFYDADAVRESAHQKNVAERGHGAIRSGDLETLGLTSPTGRANPSCTHPLGRNLRTVWNIPTQPFSEAHFATFPERLARTCILAGSREGDTVLDPFGGSGTTGLVADKTNRDCILIELNPEYAAMARRRIEDSAPMLANVEFRGPEE